MKIKLNENYPGIKKLQNALVMEFPELNLRVKPRSKWGLEKPSFKLGKKLYEFDTEEALLGKLHSLIAKEPEQAAIVLDVERVEGPGAPKLELFNDKEELVLEVPLEKYDLDNLNIKLRLGAHEERSSSYEVEYQTLSYHDGTEEETSEEGAPLSEEDVQVTQGEEDILLNIPVAKYNLTDLNVKIKFSNYGEASSTYEVKAKEEAPAKDEEENTPQEPGPEA